MKDSPGANSARTGLKGLAVGQVAYTAILLAGQGKGRVG